MTKERRARQILLAIAHGVDPLTGAEIERTTVLHHADVLRALLAGAAALEHMAARAQRRSHLPDNVGRPWTSEEEQKLITAFKSGETPANLAAIHSRTLRAIEARLERLGLLTSEQRTTRDRFLGPSGNRGGLKN